MIVSESELEVKAIDALRPFIGKNPEQIESILKEHLNPLSKNYYRTLADRMLGSSPDIKLELFEKGVSIRAIRLQKNSMPKESMSLPAFRFDEIVEQEWMGSDLKKQLESRFLFLVFKTEGEDESGITFANASFWRMPNEDVERVSFVWEDTKRKIQEEKYDSFISKSANLLVHVRPHAQSASDTQTYKGKEYRKYSFWLNNDYIGEVLARLPRMTLKVEAKDKPTDLEGAILQQLTERDAPMLPFKLKRSIDPELLVSESYEDVVNSLIQRGLVDRTTEGIRLKKCKLKEMLKEAPETVTDYFTMEKDVFRKKYPDMKRPYKVWFYPVLIYVIIAIMAGLAINTFVEDMSSGKGWIALAALSFGRWSPLGVLAAAMLFGLEIVRHFLGDEAVERVRAGVVLR